MVLRKRIILASLVFGVLASFLLIAMFYWLLHDYFRAEFEESKLSLSKAIAASIDGDTHRRLANSHDASDPEYKRYFAALQAILAADKTITYAYTLYREPDSGEFFYVIDGGVNETDKVWLENNLFALEAHIDEQGKVAIDFNGKTLHDDFDLKINDKNYGRIELRNQGEWTHVQWAGKTLFGINNQPPLRIKVEEKLIDHSVRPWPQSMIVDGKEIQNSYLLSKKGESFSLPGDPHNDTEESHALIFHAMQNDVDSLWRSKSIYGPALTSSAAIRDSDGEVAGLVLLELYDRSLDKKKFLLLSVSVALPIIFVLIAITYAGSERLIIRRVKSLNDGVAEIIRRNFKMQVEVTGNDEFSSLAKNFNQMAKAIEDNMSMLESRIEERTGSLQQRTSELIETQKKLVAQEKMAALGIFTAGIAHEINNPINFISAGVQNAAFETDKLQSFIDELLDADTEPEIKDEFSKHFGKISAAHAVIKTGTKRIEKVVKQLRTNHPEGDVGMQPTDAVSTLESAWQVFLPTLKMPISLAKTLEDRPTLDCAVAEIQQVFIALLSNAADAIEDATAERGDAYEGNITLTSAQTNDHLLITISDNGTGIPADNIEKIFDPFFTTKVVGRGAGLGLSMARDVVKKHHGTLAVKSTVGEGSTFILRLPLSQPG
jgi:signal transduction histidine kinase